MIYSLGSNFELHCTLKASAHRYIQVHALCRQSALAAVLLQLLTATVTRVCIPEFLHCSVPAWHRLSTLSLWKWSTGKNQRASCIYIHLPWRATSGVFCKAWLGTQRALNLIKREASVWLNLNRLLNHNKSKSFKFMRCPVCAKYQRKLETWELR